METSVNNKCKAFTSLEQSRKLAEILPLESADMFWLVVGNTPRVHVLTEPLSNYSNWKSYPAWSLAVLLNIFPYYEINNNGVNIQLSVKGEALITEKRECLLDLVVNMIIHLHKLKCCKLEKQGEQNLAEWSEEDERCLLTIQKIICDSDTSASLANKLSNWVQSLKDRVQPKNTWKPTQEQMRALDIAIRCGIQLGSSEETALRSLLEQLEDLKGLKEGKL